MIHQRVLFVCGLGFLGALAARSPDARADDRIKVVKRERAEAAPAGSPDQINWTWAAVAQPFDLLNGGYANFEVQRAINRDKNHSHSLALAFWGSQSTKDDGLSSYGDSRPAHKTLDKRLYGLAARYKLYLMRSFHFNFGAGFRSTSTKETAVFDAGDSAHAEKSATVLGADLGLGNRWVLANGLVLGGNWLQVFVPGVTLASENAKVPAGYVARKAGSDAKAPSYRLGILELGYAW